MTRWHRRVPRPSAEAWRIPLLLVGALALAACATAIRAAEPPAAGATTDATVGPDAVAPVTVPEPSTDTLRYSRSGNVLWVVATRWGLLVPAAIVFSGVSARLRTWAQAVGRHRFFTMAVYVRLYLALVHLID